MSTWPNGQGTGLRIRRMQVRLLPSTPSRRSSAEQSAALRRRRSHVRIVPARPALPNTPEETPLAASTNGGGEAKDQALVAQEAERVPGTDEVVGANPTEGPTEGIRPDEEPVCYAGTGRQPLWVRVPPLPLRKRSGWIRSLSRKQVGVARPLGVRVAPLPHSPRTRRSEAVLGERDGAAESTMPRWSRGQDTGPSTRRPGFDSPSRYSHTPMPGGRAARRPAVTRKAGVRAPPWQRTETSTLGGRGVQARGCQSWR
jgi:hypothetical protein